MRAVYQQTIVDEAGNVVPGATIAIRDALGTLVPLYEELTGPSSPGNPASADGDGYVRVYVDPGQYLITIDDGTSQKDYPDVLIGAAVELLPTGAPAYVAYDPGVVTQLDDFAVAETTKFVDFDTANTLRITGMVASFDGQEVTLSTKRAYDEGSGTMVFIMALDDDSDPANQFQLAGDLTLLQYMSFTFIYCAAIMKWRLK